jgi:hypothetical protein
MLVPTEPLIEDDEPTNLEQNYLHLFHFHTTSARLLKEELMSSPTALCLSCWPVDLDLALETSKSQIVPVFPHIEGRREEQRK